LFDTKSGSKSELDNGDIVTLAVKPLSGGLVFCFNDTHLNVHPQVVCFEVVAQKKNLFLLIDVAFNWMTALPGDVTRPSAALARDRSAR
jgi:hypothetical protein